jgi:hypothetical protein
VAAVAIVACNDPALFNPNENTPGQGERGTSRSAFAPGECGTSATLITYDNDDSVANALGWPALADTVDLCETWTGGDYSWKTQTVGTSETFSDFYDMARDLSYASGWMSVTEGGTVVQTSPISGASILDFYVVDQASRDAVADDPYYALASGGGGGGGGGCEPPDCYATSRSGPETVSMPRDSMYRRHGVRRRGVRALIETADDAGLSNEGYRRFVKRDPRGDHVYLVDPRTELLVGEESVDGDLEIVSRHEWKPVRGGFVRDQTVTETRSRSAGGRVLGTSIVLFRNVRVAGR